LMCARTTSGREGARAALEDRYDVYLAEDAAALIRGLGIGPAVVAGSSMSAAVVVELAAGFPELVRAVVLVGGFAKLGPPGKEIPLAIESFLRSGQ